MIARDANKASNAGKTSTSVTEPSYLFRTGTLTAQKLSYRYSKVQNLYICVIGNKWINNRLIDWQFFIILKNLIHMYDHYCHILYIYKYVFIWTLFQFKIHKYVWLYQETRRAGGHMWGRPKRLRGMQSCQSRNLYRGVSGQF